MLWIYMIIISKEIKNIGYVRHGFFTKKGGVSSGIYESLNCGPGSNDSPENVKENRARVAEKIGVSPEKLCTLYQIHSADVVTVSEPWPYGASPKADGMVTKNPGIALGILTADCAPVLFADEKNKVIGAAHAGWKGAKAGVVKNTITEMVKLGADISSIKAAIGPCIGFMSYEVGAEFRENFLKDSEKNEGFFGLSERENYFMFNLTAFVASQLREAGIKNSNIDLVGHDTLRDEENFFSFRRTTLRAEKDYGRQISVITLLP